MHLLFPGRHHLFTQFQFHYIRSLVEQLPGRITDVHGATHSVEEPVEALIFAVTSANHHNTRRNPLPFYLRAIQAEAFAAAIGCPGYVYGIDDVGNLPNFASYTLKRIRHDSEQRFQLNPSNTLVICSTPVLNMYADLGFTVLPAELLEPAAWTYRAALPWHFVEQIAQAEDWKSVVGEPDGLHPSSAQLWKKYRIGDKVQLLFRDHMISADGDLTESRDYNVYVRQMDEIAQMKYREVAPFIQPGRIGDIGCAVGSWIRLASSDERFRESDFYGVEVSRQLYEICLQRKLNGEFANPFVFFAQRNAVQGHAFEPQSMNTIHTSSLTHEIESYGSHEDLLQFIRNRYEELAPGGVWINRDVVGPEHKDRFVYLWLDASDGANPENLDLPSGHEALKSFLAGLSTRSRFRRFCLDFRRAEGYTLLHTMERIGELDLIRLRLSDAMEFLSRKDYIDNWLSEMHERFCFWDFTEWTEALVQAGFRVHPDSRAYRNDWIVANRFTGKAALYTIEEEELRPLEFPVTHMLLIAIKNG